MRVTLWGTRGSLATPGYESARYGGNTSCVEVRDGDGWVIVLDAGTGIRRLGAALGRSVRRVDVLLTHLHLDHILGLGFFAPLYIPGVEVHIWGPASTTASLRTRLTRYLSPPLFPVRLRDLMCTLHLHESPRGQFEIGAFRVTSALVVHPGPTVGYRLERDGVTVTYIPDHEPSLGHPGSWLRGEWTSGYALAAGADLLIHDAQYTDDEYATRHGWGHSSIRQTLELAALAGVKHLVPFHHDPDHDDERIDRILAEAVDRARPSFRVTGGMEGATFDLAAHRAREAGAAAR